MRTNIKGDKELGLAEALLIGYKDDLDKTLVQSYSNTGVVHIIAISGLHLGLIYWLLNLLLKPLSKRKKWRWLRPIIAVSCLWFFSLLAGGISFHSSIRSHVYLYCCRQIVFARKTSIYNTLAVSAFFLLCYNPYWLWDVGFQLSYSAVLSIIIFMQPIYNLFYIKNKFLDFIWKLNAVTLGCTNTYHAGQHLSFSPVSCLFFTDQFYSRSPCQVLFCWVKFYFVLFHLFLLLHCLLARYYPG